MTNKCEDCIHNEYDADDEDEYQFCDCGHTQLMSGNQPEECKEFKLLW